MDSIKRQYRLIAEDSAASRVYQAFERLQIAWYTISARSPAKEAPQLDATAMRELNAAEEEWLAARESVSISC